MFFFFFKPFSIISNFKTLFLSSYNKFNRSFFKTYDLLFFKHKFLLKNNKIILNSLFGYYSEFVIRKFIFSNFIFYFIFLLIL